MCSTIIKTVEETFNHFIITGGRKMKKTYMLDGLCCANCAAKIERGIAAIDGVSGANLSFLTTKLTFEAEDEKIDEITKKAKKIIRKIEPDVDMKEL